MRALIKYFEFERRNISLFLFICTYNTSPTCPPLNYSVKLLDLLSLFP